MKAAYFSAFQSTITIENLPDPELSPNGVIIKVKATGLCRSDWHGWMGHDSDLQLPHVPGHEFAGIIQEVGRDVKNWKKGARVTLPFSCGCGYCVQCLTGNQQICDNYFQPGFTAWGSFAEYVHIPYADVNLVALPESISFEAAAVLGCRFITSYRGVVAQGQLKPGQWLAVYGCGGVGLSAIMIGNAIGANVIAIDIEESKLALAKTLGAQIGFNAAQHPDIPQQIKELTKGGVTVSVDALGSPTTCVQSIQSLKKQGKHIQIGLIKEPIPNGSFPMGAVIANELEIIGSHGMQAHKYPELLDLILSKALPLDKMIGQRLSLEEGIRELPRMESFTNVGTMVINQF